MKTRPCRFFNLMLKRWGANRWKRRPSRAQRRTRTSHAFALSAAACLSFGPRAWAEEVQAGAVETPPAAAASPSPTPNGHGRSMPEVLVTGQTNGYKPDNVESPKYTQPLLDTPQTINVVNKQVIQDQNATTLRDILRNVSGISMQAGEGGVPNGDNLSIRGFNARTDIFVDNVRDFGGYTRDAFNIEQVEVVKGPASVYSGRGSTGGTINMSSKQAGLEPSRSGTIGMGTDNYKRATFDVNQPLKLSVEGSALRLNGMWMQNDTPNRDSVSNERWGLAPSLAFGLGTPTRLNLDYMHLEQDNMPDYGIPWVPDTNVPLASQKNKIAPVDYSNFYGLLARDFEETTTDIGTAQLHHDMNDNVSVRGAIRYGTTYRDSVITAPRFNSTSSTAINRQLQSRDQKDTILGTIADVTSKFKTGPVAHTLVTGVEFDSEKSVNYARTAPNAPLADLFNPNPNDAYTGNVTRSGARTEAESNNGGAYLFDTAEVTDQWQVSGGLRWDSFDLDYVSVSTGNVKTPLSRKDEMPSYRAGVVFKPVPIGSLYAAYGTSFNPSTEGLTLSNAANATNNVNTDPEENRTVEVGTKWDVFDRRANVTAALFQTEKINARTIDPVDQTVSLDGEQRVQGVELGLGGQLLPQWSITAGYTYMNSKVVESDNPIEEGRELANTPRHSGSLWTTYQLPFNTELGGGVQYVGDRFNSTTTPRLAEGYWLGDLMAAYKFNPNFTLRLNVYNIADVQYLGSVGGGHSVPGAGRSAVVTSEVKF